MSLPSPRSPSILEHFVALRDPREGWRVLYPLREILLVVLCATLCGMDDVVEVKLWGEARLDVLRRFLPFERGIPSHDTLGDVMDGIDAELFESCFAEWVETLRDGQPDIVAVDGKTSRRCHDRARGREPLHLVSAWATRQRLVLGQEATADKSNGITAIPLLLERLDLAGALVTIDAMGTQTAIADTIVRRGGDDPLSLEANRPATHDDVARFFADPPTRPGAGRPHHNGCRSRARRGAAPRRLPRRVLDVVRPALPRPAPLSSPGHDRHGRNQGRARRQAPKREAIPSDPLQMAGFLSWRSRRNEPVTVVSGTGSGAQPSRPTPPSAAMASRGGRGCRDERLRHGLDRDVAGERFHRSGQRRGGRVHA